MSDVQPIFKQRVVEFVQSTRRHLVSLDLQIVVDDTLEIKIVNTWLDILLQFEATCLQHPMTKAWDLVKSWEDEDDEDAPRTTISSLKSAVQRALRAKTNRREEDEDEDEAVEDEIANLLRGYLQPTRFDDNCLQGYDIFVAQVTRADLCKEREEDAVADESPESRAIVRFAEQEILKIKKEPMHLLGFLSDCIEALIITSTHVRGRNGLGHLVLHEPLEQGALEQLQSEIYRSLQLAIELKAPLRTDEAVRDHDCDPREAPPSQSEPSGENAETQKEAPPREKKSKKKLKKKKMSAMEDEVVPMQDEPGGPETLPDAQARELSAFLSHLQVYWMISPLPSFVQMEHLVAECQRQRIRLMINDDGTEFCVPSTDVAQALKTVQAFVIKGMTYVRRTV